MKKLFAAIASVLDRPRDPAAPPAALPLGVSGGPAEDRAPTVEPEKPVRRSRRKSGAKRPRAAAAQASPSLLAEDTSDLNYRFGFVIHPSAATVASPDLETWRTERVGGYTIRLHPETSYLGADGVAVIGPVVGRGGASVEGVLNALLTASPDRFAALLGDLVGRFAVFVIRPDGARVFNDAFGSRTVFYSARSPGLVASHSALLAELIGAPLDDSVRHFMTTRPFTNLKVRYLPGDLTLFQDLYGLSPNNSYRMDGRTERYWPVSPLQATDRELFYSLLDQNMADLARLGKDRNFILGITGGADSRAICAGLVKHSKPFDGVTWITPTGNYLPPSERPAVDQTVAILGLRHQYINVQGALERQGIASRVNTGLLRGESRLTSSMARISGPGDVFVRGYGGEIIRGFYNVGRDPMTSASPDEFGRMFQKRNPKRDRFVLRTFEAYWRRANWDFVGRTGHDANDLFYWEHRMGMWGAMMLNQMDSGVESWVGLNSRPLYEAAFGLPPQERLTKAIFAEAIRRFHKPLADVPIH